MKIGSSTKDLLSGIVLLALNIFLYMQISEIRWGNPQFVYSAAFLPLTANILLSVLVVALIGKSIAKGGARVKLAEFGGAIKNGVKTAEFRTVGIAIVTIFLLIWVAMPLLGFWISGAIYMLFILLFFVKKFKPWVSIIVTAVSLAVIYGIFNLIFMVPLR
jgi:hypothetical protein